MVSTVTVYAPSTDEAYPLPHPHLESINLAHPHLESINLAHPLLESINLAHPHLESRERTPVGSSPYDSAPAFFFTNSRRLRKAPSRRLSPPPLLRPCPRYSPPAAKGVLGAAGTRGAPSPRVLTLGTADAAVIVVATSPAGFALIAGWRESASALAPPDDGGQPLEVPPAACRPWCQYRGPQTDSC